MGMCTIKDSKIFSQNTNDSMATLVMSNISAASSLRNKYPADNCFLLLPPVLKASQVTKDAITIVVSVFIAVPSRICGIPVTRLNAASAKMIADTMITQWPTIRNNR